jgi:TPR repeat protein
LDAALKYHYGRGVEKNLDQALKLYEASASFENTTSMVNLSFIFMMDQTLLNLEKAFEYALRAAQLDNPTAMNNVGWSYHKGLGVSLDIHQAIFWYKRASNLNNAESMYSLGTIYEEGLVEGGLKVADTWYKKAAKLDHPKAKLKISNDQMKNTQ